MSVCEKPLAATLLIFFDSTTKTDAPIGLDYSRLRFVMVVSVPFLSVRKKDLS